MAANITEADRNSTKASTNRTDPGEDEQIWGFWQHQQGPCADYYNDLLGNFTEYNKAGSSTASTIMALLPALLAFSPLTTARIGLLSAVSNPHGYFAAVFTFGLPVDQLDTVHIVKSIKKHPGNIEDAPPTPPPPTNPPMLQPVNNSTPTNHPPATVNLNTQGAIELVPLVGSSSPSSNPGDGTPTQECVNPSASMETVENALALIKHLAFSNQHSTSILPEWVLQLGLFSMQLLIVRLLIMTISDFDPSTMIWACPGPGPHTIAWLVGVICIVGPIRVGYESLAFAATEAIHISKASRTGTTGDSSTMLDPQPMIVILRPSPRDISGLDMQSTIALISRRSFQLLWLLLLSFFFSGTVGGSIFSSLYTVCSIVCIVTASRVMSIFTVKGYKNLHVIEYDNPEELGEMRRRIGALPQAWVEVRETCASLKFSGIKWRECIESYQEGQQEGHRNAAHGATYPVCSIHAHKPGYQWLVKGAIPLVCVVLLVALIFIVPTLFTSFDWLLTAAVAMVSIMGWKRSIVLCNCGIDDAQPV